VGCELEGWSEALAFWSNYRHAKPHAGS
jgi:hypothetical protein